MRDFGSYLDELATEGWGLMETADDYAYLEWRGDPDRRPKWYEDRAEHEALVESREARVEIGLVCNSGARRPGPDGQPATVSELTDEARCSLLVSLDKKES